MQSIIAVFGIFVFLGIAWLFSMHKKAIKWRVVFWGLGLQFTFAFFILPDSFFNRTVKNIFHLQEAPGAWFFSQLNDGIQSLLSFTNKGTDFLIQSTSLQGVAPGFENFIFRVLPTILFFSALMAVLYHLGIIQRVVKVIARLMSKTMGTSGPESLSAAANIFVGQTEAPLVIKPYISSMTQSELLAIMTGGMATVAGGILAAYVAFLSNAIPDIAGHLMAASVMSAPAALMISKLLLPETKNTKTAEELKMEEEKKTANVIDAAAQGASEGVKLAMNVGAMLLVFIALIALINAPFQALGNWLGVPLSMEIILGKLFAPVAFLMGVSWDDAATIGTLLGKKTVINEFVAFHDLSVLVQQKEPIARKSLIIATYALCGFSNFSSIAIQIGGIGSIASHRKSDLAKLGGRALLGGSLACFMTASVAGLLSYPTEENSRLFGLENSSKNTVLLQTNEIKHKSMIDYYFDFSNEK